MYVEAVGAVRVHILCVGGTVGIGEDAVFVYLYARTYKDMVNSGICISCCFPPVESSCRSMYKFSQIARIGENVCVDNFLIACIGLIYVEVAGKEYRTVGVEFLNLAYDEFHALGACFHAHMVGMKVEIKELTARSLVQETMRILAASQPLLGMSGVSDSQKFPESSTSKTLVL